MLAQIRKRFRRLFLRRIGLGSGPPWAPDYLPRFFGSLGLFGLRWLLLFLWRDLRQLFAQRFDFVTRCASASVKMSTFRRSSSASGWPTVVRCPRLRSGCHQLHIIQFNGFAARRKVQRACLRVER